MKSLAFAIALVVLLLGAGTAYGQDGPHVELRVTQPEGGVTLRWRVDSEAGVEGYHVWRILRGDMQKLTQAPVAARGLDWYTYTDRSLFKAESEQATYYVEVLFSDGRPALSSEKIDVNYTSTAVRRTWGSIKAMFQ